MAGDGGRLVLVFDDGYVEDYDEIRPVLRAAGVPACFAVNPTSIGDSNHLSPRQLERLADEGCEIAAHGRSHRFLRGQRLSRAVAPGDDRLYVADRVYPDGAHGILRGDRLEVTDGTTREPVEVVEKGQDDTGKYLDVAESVDSGYPRGETVVRPTEALIHDEVVGAAEDLLGLGFDPRTFVFPYDAADARAWTTARRHYDAIPNAAVRSLPNLPGTPLSSLQRYSLETDALTRVELAEYLDAVDETAGLGILGGHSAWDTAPPERIAWVIETARERGIGLTTFRALRADGELAV